MRIINVFLGTFLVFGCVSQSPENKILAELSLVDRQATIETKALFVSLKKISANKLLFGHQDATAYGIGWRNEDLRSDVHDVCGKFPAVYGWDLGHIGDTMNIDSVSFERMKFWIQSAYDRGGINTISLHLLNPVTGGSSWDVTPAVAQILPGGQKNSNFNAELILIANFLNDLKSKNGVAVPVILRLFHEHNGGWFWWGANSCSPQEYKELFKYTVGFLRDSCNVHNVLYAYSPDKFSGETEYLERFPGYDYADVLGLDNYWHFKSGDTKNEVLEQIRVVVNLAEANNKIAALTETGLEGITNPEWFTKVLLEPIKNDSIARKIAWVLVWRNANKTHHYAPYPGHASADDFIKFENDSFTVFEEDLPLMYKLQ